MKEKKEIYTAMRTENWDGKDSCSYKNFLVYPYGWRGRIGLLIPSGDFTSPLAVRKITSKFGDEVQVIDIPMNSAIGIPVKLGRGEKRPPWVSEENWQKTLVNLHKGQNDDKSKEVANGSADENFEFQGTMYDRGRWTEEELAKNFGPFPGTPQAAEYAWKFDVGVIAYGCTSGSFFKGKKDPLWHLCLSKMIEDHVGIHCITATEAVLKALKVMGIQKVLLYGPYEEVILKRMKETLEGNGFNILYMDALGKYRTGIRRNIDLTIERPETVYRQVKQSFTPEADAIFVSCTAYRAVEVIEKMENDFKVPVITSNQALAWASLRYLGINEPVLGYGKLLRDY